MPKPKKRTRKIQVRLTPKEFRDIKAAAREADRTVAWMVRAWLHDYLESRWT